MAMVKPLTAATVGASLAFAAPAYPSGVHNSPSDEVICEGWVLKKRRKRMQGFARRYFTLHQSGLLSYSFEPGQPSRDQILLLRAAISTAPGRKDIHVDSSTATFHIKCLNAEDFQKWMIAFRKFIANPDGRKSTVARLTPRANYLTKSGAIIEEMGSTLAELESAILAWQQEHATKKQRSRSRTKADKDRHKDHAKETGSVFGLFKKSNSNHGNYEPPEPQQESDRASARTSRSSQLRIHVILEALKAQHATLSKSFQTLTHESASSLGHISPLPLRTEEEEQDYSPVSRFPTPFSRTPKRTSISATTISDNNSEWFDAVDDIRDGAEEFVLESTPEEQGSKMTRINSHSSITEDPGADTDTEDEGIIERVRAISEDTHTDVRKPDDRVVCRTQLPARPVSDEGSLFAILKKNVGKDLSTIAFPVTFNEPLTLLQRAAEEMEYYDLLREAAEATDAVERLSFVAAFAVSSYAHTRHRSGRKGFNPMLAETYEDARMKFIAEKVCHHPLIMAYHAEGDDWELSATSSGKTKFWGKSLEIIPLGSTHLRIGNDHFQWKKPSSFMRNLVVGTKYLEHCGQTIIENTTTAVRCILDFKQNGYFGPSNVVSGTILSASGSVLSQLEGKWDEQFARTLDSSHFRVLWRMTPFPKNTHEYYGFTSFGITLNEITSNVESKLPPTDSRYRPDVRALEEGDLNLAESEKVRVEEMQRERRKKGEDREPRWFKQVDSEWEYTGGYWEKRIQGWKDVKPLW